MTVKGGSRHLHRTLKKGKTTGQKTKAFSQQKKGTSETFGALDRPFELYAMAATETESGGTPPSSSSSGDLELFLSAEETEIDLGKITLPEWTQLKQLNKAVTRANELYNRLINFKAKLQQKTITQQDIDRATEDARELEKIQKELEKLTSDIVLGHGQPDPFPKVKLTVSSTPTNRVATIKILGVEQVRARPGNPLDSLGRVDGPGGTTTFSGHFVPNGNYGIVTFQASSGDVVSNKIQIVVKGMCRGECPKETGCSDCSD